MPNESDSLVILAALAQETRLRVVRILLACLPSGLPAGRVGLAVGCAPSTLTFHLRQLEQAGLVVSRRQGTSIIYSAVPDAFTGVVEYLLNDCCGGRPELCAPAIGPSPPPKPEPEVADCCGPRKSVAKGSTAKRFTAES